MEYNRTFLRKLKENYFMSKALYETVKEQAEEIEKATNRCISTEVTGFYYGEPDFEYTEKYQNTRKAEF